MRPELWAVPMASAAIADWFLMYEDQADRLRGYQRALFRGTPDETAEATAKASDYLCRQRDGPSRDSRGE